MRFIIWFPIVGGLMQMATSGYMILIARKHVRLLNEMRADHKRVTEGFDVALTALKGTLAAVNNVTGWTSPAPPTVH